MKKIVLGLLGVAVLGGLVYLGTKHANQPPAPAASTTKVKVAAAFYPLAHFAQQVGGDNVDVTNVTPAGEEPHDYEPTPKQIADLYDAKLLLANGSGLD